VLLLSAGATTASAQVTDTARVARRRIIGVFAAEAGTPLEGVQVVDAFSGTYTTAHSGSRAIRPAPRS
jgi:hypothetical protein